MTYKSVVNKIKQVKPEIFFLAVSLIAGLTILILTPPFQVPDEINHFYKSYQISDGQLISKTTDNRLGGYVPESFVEITKPFLGIRWNINAKTEFKRICSQFAILLNEDDKVFVDFPNRGCTPQFHIFLRPCPYLL